MSEWKLGDANKTMSYLLPLLNQNGKIKVSNFYSTNSYPQKLFVNVFSKCEEYPDLNNRLFLLYKKELDNPVYQNFESRLRFFPEYEFEYLPDDVHKIYVFNFQQAGIFNIFNKGKYSTFSDNYKTIIMNFYELNPELFIKNSDNHKNRIVGVLFKQKWLKDEIESTVLNSESTLKKDWVRLEKDSEYSSIPYEEKETFLNKYKMFL